MNPRLQYRHELKYYMNTYQYQAVRARLRQLLERDKHAGPAGEYHIRSLYFDDIDNKALHEKLGGVRDRVKYRIRIYNRSDRVIHLEKKIKFNEYVSKVKESLTRDMYEAIVSGDCEALNVPGRPLLHELRREIQTKLLRPKVIVDYVREAYTAVTGNVRITFDKELRTGLNGIDIFDPIAPTIPAFDDNLIVFEVKYDAYLPEYIRAAVQSEGLVRQSNSKYVVCRKLLKFNSWEDQ